MLVNKTRHIRRQISFHRHTEATRVIVGPNDLRTMDASIAKDILSGNLTFGGRYYSTTTASIFDIPPPSAAFAEELHGFSWLRHVGASNDASLRNAAQLVILDWIKTYGKTATGFAMQVPVLSRRLISWIAQAPVILEGADPEFYHNFMQSLNFQASVLRREINFGIPPLASMTAWIALNYYAQCTDASAEFKTSMQMKFLGALQEEILPDGGHVSRNPQILLDIALDLLPLQQVFALHPGAASAYIPQIIPKILSMLRLLRHSDGAIAAFNGMGVTENGLMARILPYLKEGGIPMRDASYSGYQRLEQGASVVLVDAGRPPPAKYSNYAHAGCLGFELSNAGNRIIVNCGTPVTGSKPLLRASRQTMAHSVLSIDSTSSCQFGFDDDKTRFLDSEIVKGPTELTYGREIIEGGELLVCRHNGYEHNFGLIHQRSLWLSGTGLKLEGQDMLIARDLHKKQPVGRKLVANVPVAPLIISFHLHPSVRAELNEDKTRVELVLNTKERWQFRASDQQLTLEDSIYFVTAQGQQKTRQIIVQGLAKPGARIDWVFERI